MSYKSSAINPISHGVFDHVIFIGGGLKDLQPKTGLNLVRSLWQSYHVTMSLAWPIAQKKRSLALKMRKIWAFHFLKKSLNIQKSVKFIKEKLWGAIFKTLPFGALCTNLTQSFLKFCNYKVGKVKKVRTMIAIKENDDR